MSQNALPITVMIGGLITFNFADSLKKAGWSLGYAAVVALNIGEHLLP